MEPAENGFLSGKYRRDARVTDSARATHIPAPRDSDYTVIDAVCTIARPRHQPGGGVSSLAASTAWHRVRILGARRLSHLTDNLAGLDVTLTPQHLRTLDELSAPDLNYPLLLHSYVRY